MSRLFLRILVTWFVVTILVIQPVLITVIQTQIIYRADRDGPVIGCWWVLCVFFTIVVVETKDTHYIALILVCWQVEVCILSIL